MKRRVGVCPTCGNQVGVTKGGLVVIHLGNFNGGRARCAGSSKPERADGADQ